MFPSDVVSTLDEGAVIALGDITPAAPPPAETPQHHSTYHNLRGSIRPSHSGQPPPPTKKLRCFQSQSQLQAKPSSQGAPSKAGKPDRACAPLPAPSLHVRTADRWPTVLSVRVQGPRARNIDVSLSPVLRSRPPSVGVGRVFTTFPERGRHPEVPATLAPVLCEDCVPTWERSAEARAAREPWDAKSLARRNTHEDTLWLAELRANRGCSSGASEGC
ncbi:hypothetical protein P7K49_029657 [Saguinus oedipus]|uniref:Uncharacterized protein n=1 Tax=Saguinus oedipus TaxID=9490 RepID=A0ABQ9U924_SAGOE|nr:hypothetical protein P7K49_029657 [Saguinus oedipus]